ncbi:MAG: SUMF1/EgtB/PvdO family nonheme iron enzyme [Myxococcales bacterium]|nr:SUMF1/EgtB/PvdO family nonheme iron enzyme [Myxococcales bacterium]
MFARSLSLIALGVATLAACGEAPALRDAGANDGRADFLRDLGPRTDGPGATSDADAGGAFGDGTVDAPPGTSLGTFQNPIVIGALPYTHSANTTSAPSHVANAYSPCAPGTDESGGEVVYKLVLTQPTTLTVKVDDVAGDSVDVDVHLLDAPSAQSCLARDNVSLTHAAPAGTYYIVVDTWVGSDGVPRAGPYRLDVTAGGGGSTSNCLKSPIPSCVDGVYPQVNGVPQEAAGTGGCPPGMLRASTFCIDRYEAMLVLETSSGLAPWSPYQNPGTQTVRALSVAGVVPQGYISGIQAAAACQRAGKRLCTDTEWLRACQGAAQTTYPYGNTRQAGVCNDARTCHPAIQYFESNASSVWSKLGHPCINQLPDGLDKTGANAGCVTAEGAFDMMGNLHEWTSNASGIFRGGFYVDTVINGNGCLYRTTAHPTSHWDYSTGFRCCAD